MKRLLMATILLMVTACGGKEDPPPEMSKCESWETPLPIHYENHVSSCTCPGDPEFTWNCHEWQKVRMNCCKDPSGGEGCGGVGTPISPCQ